MTTEIVLYLSDGPKETTSPPTEPPTEATEPATTIYKSINLPQDKTEPYKLSIILAGKVIVDDQEIKPGTASYMVQLTGRGTAALEVWIDGVLVRTEMVEFDD